MPAQGLFSPQNFPLSDMTGIARRRCSPERYADRKKLPKHRCQAHFLGTTSAEPWQEDKVPHPCLYVGYLPEKWQHIERTAPPHLLGGALPANECMLRKLVLPPWPHPNAPQNKRLMDGFSAIFQGNTYIYRWEVRLVPIHNYQNFETFSFLRWDCAVKGVDASNLARTDLCMTQKKAENRISRKYLLSLDDSEN